MKAVMTSEEMMAFLEEVFPQIKSEFEIERMDGETTHVRLKVDDRHLRPGGTVSGPSMFSLADVAAYIATMACIGKQAMAVTTNCSMDFMRKPKAGKDIIARAQLLKLGRALSVVDMLLYSEGSDDPVARASMTYSIPPKG